MGFGLVNVSVRWSCGRRGSLPSNSPDVFMASQADIVGTDDNGVKTSQRQRAGAVGAQQSFLYK